MQPIQVHDWQRLHPSAVAIWSVERARGALLAVVAAGAARRLWFVGAIAVSILVLGLGLAFLRQRRFCFRLEGDSLVVRDGVIQLRHTVIPLERIQSVDIIQKLRHRVFGVVELRAEAIGGEQSEASLVALPREVAEELRRRLLRLEELEPRDADQTPVLARLGLGDLVLAGVTGGRVAIFAVLLGYLDDLLPGDVIELAFRRAFERARGGASLAAYLLLPILIIIGISIALSLVATALRYWDFTITREEQRLVITRGLLEKRRSAVPLNRVQAVRIVENPIRRALRLASLTVVVAGYSGPREEIQETSMLLPIAPRDKAVSIATHVTGIPEAAVGDFQRTPARALIPSFAASVVLPWLAVAGFLLLRSWFAISESEVGGVAFRLSEPRAIVTFGLVMMVLFVGMSIAGWRARASRFSDRVVILREGVVIRRTTLIPLTNVQSVQVTAGPVSRMLRLASLTFGVPKAPSRAWRLDQTRALNSFEDLSLNLYH